MSSKERTGGSSELELELTLEQTPALSHSQSGSRRSTRADSAAVDGDGGVDDAGEDVAAGLADLSLHPHADTARSSLLASTAPDSLSLNIASASATPPISSSSTSGSIAEDGRHNHAQDKTTDRDGNIVVATNIHKTYLLGVEGVPALRGVSLSIKKGEFIMILGSSGGGKTSLLNILGTIDKPTKGELILCGQRITSSTTDESFANLRLNRLGFCFQSFNLIPSMTAQENVALPMVLTGKLSTREIDNRARMLLQRVGLGDRMDHLPSQLSGGEQQRTTIARAIANRPKLLLLDEPTGDLDTLNGTIILSLLLHLNRVEGMTCVMVTHDTALKNYAHRVIHMVDGKIARMEHVKSEVREEMDKNLAIKVAQIRGEWSGAIPTPSQPQTEYRDASDYSNFLRDDDDEEEDQDHDEYEDDEQD